MDTALIVELISSLDGLQAVAAEWDAIAASVELPMLSHAWILAAAMTLLAPHGLRVILVRRDDGVAAAAAPLAARARAGTERLELIGASHLYEPSGLLFSSDQALERLLHAIVEQRQPFVLSRIPLSSRIGEKLTAAVRGRGIVMSRRTGNCLQVPIASSWAEYLGRMSSQRRYDLRRARRRAEAAGPVTARVHSPSRGEVDGLLAEFVRVEAAGWKARRGSSLSQRPALRAFFEQYARLAAAEGRLRVSLLEVRGTAIAAQVSVEYARRLWVLKIGYDEAWSRCSPGWLLLAETMRWAFERRLESYEFLGADESWLHGWHTVPRELCSVGCYPPSMAGLYGFASDMLGRARARVRRARAD